MADNDGGVAWAQSKALYDPSRRDTVFLILAGIFLTHALLAEVTGGKLIAIAGFTMSIGVIPWPVVFVTTDLVNEYYGPKAVRRLTLLAVGLIVYSFAILFIAIQVPASDISPVSDGAFSQVFGQSLWIIVGSVTAFALSQLIDALVFVFARSATGGKMLWLRAMASTVVSQLIDTFVVTYVAFRLPGKMTTAEMFEVSFSSYIYKFVIAVATVPVIYLGHGIVDRYLGRGPDPADRGGD